MNKLPKIGRILITEKNQNILTDFKNKFYTNMQSCHICQIDSWFDYPQIETHAYGATFKRKNSVEISFETFEKLVLGINKEKHYELW